MLALHAIFVALLVGMQTVFTVLAVVNVRHSRRAVERERDWLTGRLGVENPERSLSYHRARTGVSLLQSWTALVVLLVALYGGYLGDAVAALGAVPWPLARGPVLFVAVVVAYRLLAAPFDAFETFVVEREFDLDHRTPARWARDAAVTTVLLAALVGVASAATLWFVTVLPDAWWVAGWLLVVGGVVVLRVAYPRVVVPLFNDLERIEDGGARAAVVRVFDAAGFDDPAVYQVNASEQSSRLEAYVTGLGRTKRVVLYDTLVEELDREQLESVLAHELAHLDEHHFWKGLAGLAVQAAVVAALLGYLVGADWLPAAFGLPPGATHARLFVGLLWAYPVLQLTAPARNWLFARYERRADAYAAEVMGDGAPLADALCRLADENYSNPFPHPAYVAFHYDHPTIPARVRALRGDS